MEPVSFYPFLSEDGKAESKDIIFLNRKKSSATLFTNKHGLQVQIMKTYKARNFTLPQARTDFSQALKKITARKLTPRVYSQLAGSQIKIRFGDLSSRVLIRKRRSERLSFKGKSVKFDSGDLVKIIYKDAIVYVNRTCKRMRVADEFPAY